MAVGQGCNRDGFRWCCGRWSDESKAQAVAVVLGPGVTVSALARRLGISPPQLFGWRKAFLKKQARTSRRARQPLHGGDRGR
ncbi:transposase [Lacimonas salitolerans]|uniref:Transposase n=1 Tax=Lacimonas salitolerans TaxID=1323750 RepID=A0ABW4ECZ2_9RHOB